MRIELLLIDEQNDFHDQPNATLGVPGACEDAKRVVKMIRRLKDKLDDIHVTLDTHQQLAIFHPMFWINGKGEHPTPFTNIELEDVEQKKWKAFNPVLQAAALNYVTQLKSNGRYTLTIWPYHCLAAHWGGNIYGPVAEELDRWEQKYFGRVGLVAKGHNFLTEHYSAVQADVPDPNDPSTLLNTRLIDTLQGADLVLIAGQASSHCVANTGRDIADNFGDDSVKKLVFLTDAMSPVPNCEGMAEDFLKDVAARGAQLTTTAQFLS